MHVNKVSHVTTIDHVAADLGESKDWLFEVTCEMDTEEGVIWIWWVGQDAVMAFTDFGIENFDRTDQPRQKRSDAPGTLKTPDCNARGLRRMATNE